MKVLIGPYRKKGNRTNKIRIDRYDLWSIDDTLSRIILPIMKRFRKNVPGTPAAMFDNPWGIVSKEQSEAAHTKWLAIIDKIIWSMQEISGDTNFSSDDLYEMREYEWRIQEGCELLGKYFRNFWY